MTSGPINLQLKSFAKAEDANEICDLLNREGGVNYTVAPDNNLGFTVTRSPANTQQKQKVSKINKSKPTAYRQSIKGFIPHFLEMGLGALLVANPYIVIGWIFAFLNVQKIPEWFTLHASEVCRLGGFFVLLYGLRFIYSYYSVNHYFDNDGVILVKGIIAQNQVQIRFGDIKTISVHQGIVDRLIGIGTVHLASASTNGEVDIILNNVINPVELRIHIQKLTEMAKHQSYV